MEKSEVVDGATGDTATDDGEKHDQGDDFTEGGEKHNPGDDFTEDGEKHDPGDDFTEDGMVKDDSETADIITVSDHGDVEVDDLDLGSSADLTGDKRNVLYDKGLCFARDGKTKSALRCYLHCLSGLDNTNEFTCLPLCLRNVADIYYQQEEYEKAVQFIQAEKLYYETALIDTSELQQKLEERRNVNGEEVTPEVTSEMTSERADEYEKLAKMCLEKKQPQLALEYQGKATKLRQQRFGDGHPVTTASLDFFTVIYGEVGKQQYAASMQKLDDLTASEGELRTDDPSPDGADSIECQNKKTADTSEIVHQATPDSSFEETSEETREQEEYISRAAVWLLFVLCILCLSIIVFYAYCKLDASSRSCAAWHADMHLYYNRCRYYYYYYMSSETNKYG